MRRSAVRFVRRAVSALLASALLTGAVLATPGPASAAELDAIAIGDSVMLGAKSTLKKRGVKVVDAKVSRQAYTGPGLLRERGSALPQHVVVHLGTNGTYTLKMCKDLVKAAGDGRTVYLVNLKVPRSWEKKNNRMLSKCDSKFRSDQVVLLDWNALASQHPEYLYADGIHLRPEGAKAFARMVEKAVSAPRAPYSDTLVTSATR